MGLNPFQVLLFFLFDLSTQGKGEEKFELVTSTSLNVIYN